MSLPSRQHRRRAFTLLEVIVAIGILAVTLVVLVEVQLSSVFLTTDSRRLSTATVLADEKMQEVILTLEREGWTTQDIDEDGDYEDFGSEEFRGEDINVDVDHSEFKWAYTVRRIELNMPSDLSGTAETLADGGGLGAQAQEDGLPDMGLDMSMIPGFSPDMIMDELSGFMREVRVRVWWGENEEGEDQVEIVHHVINPTGVVTSPEQEGN
jgi:prepilin-type N-terminal cleavage/methylation domain-containing protein